MGILELEMSRNSLLWSNFEDNLVKLGLNSHSVFNLVDELFPFSEFCGVKFCIFSLIG